MIVLYKDDGSAKLFISLFSFFFLMMAEPTPFLYIRLGLHLLYLSFGLHLLYISLRFVAKGAFSIEG